ncbi:MAG: 4Fe-4S binding protein [Deltaproteobacteria bacterium]|nr:4Fe-4S binding protein [Deltaproteobacteria bacterium]
MVQTITQGVKAATGLPLIVKLTPNVTDIGTIAAAAAAGGADAIAAINTVASIPAVDIDAEVPLPNVHGKSTPGGLSGAAIRPIALRCLADIGKATQLPLSGIGGIADWHSAVEFLLLGATTVQLGTAVMFQGFKLIDPLCKGLSNYMTQKGYDRIEDFCGHAFAHLEAHSDLRTGETLCVRIAASVCTGCGRCVTACESGGFAALRLVKKKAVADPQRCDGCGLCALACPEKAIRYA